jgi:hypothetical protein
MKITNEAFDIPATLLFLVSAWAASDLYNEM